MNHKEATGEKLLRMSQDPAADPAGWVLISEFTLTFQGDLWSIFSESQLYVPSLPKEASRLTEVIIRHPHVILANRTEVFPGGLSGSAAPSFEPGRLKNAFLF